jgi:hypothetical protein
MVSAVAASVLLSLTSGCGSGPAGLGSADGSEDSTPLDGMTGAEGAPRHDAAATSDGGTSQDGATAHDGATARDAAGDHRVHDSSAHDSPSGDGSTDAAEVSTDGGEAGPDDGGTEAGTEGGCTPPTSISGACGGLGMCSFGAQYCFGGAVPNECLETPKQCACKETFTCACLIAHTKDPFDGGSLSCAPYDDGGEPWVFVTAP